MAEQKEEKSPTVPLVHLRIVSAEKYIFSDYVAYVEVEGVEGGIGIKPGHSPLLTAINSSNVVYTTEQGDKRLVNVYGGVLEVQPKSVTVLVDTAIRGEDIDESRLWNQRGRQKQNLQRVQETRITQLLWQNFHEPCQSFRQWN